MYFSIMVPSLIFYIFLLVFFIFISISTLLFDRIERTHSIKSDEIFETPT